jgi:hypothetical protein
MIKWIAFFAAQSTYFTEYLLRVCSLRLGIVNLLCSNSLQDFAFLGL